ncbi:isochorismatase family protein [Helicobacter suis]|uniref:isochorismatase family protein n=1 Tax=Helicobacter suis TaxID=104628 RepID=UPI0013D6B092|nr:isochorismatase family protein [Helicobacter suis]
MVLLIDMQEKLFPVMAESASLLESCLRFLKIAQELGVSIQASEQNPAKLGTTLEPLKPFIKNTTTKESFSAYPVLSIPKDPLFILGIETHVCVYQTAKDFLKQGFEVSLLADCTSSRDLQNKSLALEDLRYLGARVVSVEIVAFEWLQTYTHPCFKAISKIIK